MGGSIDFKMERKVYETTTRKFLAQNNEAESSFCWFLWAVPDRAALITNLCGSICRHPEVSCLNLPVWKIQIIRGQNSSLWRFSPAHAAITPAMGPSQPGALVAIHQNQLPGGMNGSKSAFVNNQFWLPSFGPTLSLKGEHILILYSLSWAFLGLGKQPWVFYITKSRMEQLNT